MGVFATYKKIIKALAESIFRAKGVNLIKLPKKIESANCKNCHYWRDSKGDIGYCSFSLVSLYVTERQVCNNWAADGALNVWDNQKVILEKNFGDSPPTPLIEIERDRNGGVLYENEEADRARAAGMISLPKDEKGVHCFNCEYSSKGEWCKLVNVHIEKNDKCNQWKHPGTLRFKK
jgi:hypothetical protein